MRTCAMALAIFLTFCNLKGLSQITTSFVIPTTATAADGSITISGLSASTTYIVSYSLDVSLQTPASLFSDANGTLVIGSLIKGIYSDIALLNGVTKTVIPGTFNLGCVANQTTKFLGAVYGNFTGVTDDDPNGYTQYYARLSTPLNKAEGIYYRSEWPKRIIAVRNLFLQLTYGNTDNFKMYTFDTLKSKYVNRLDLLAHAGLNANLELNLATLILPQNWKAHAGDISHIYLDFMSSLLSTSVTDSLTANNPATAKSYSVHSVLLGLNLKGIFKDVWGSNFNIEVGPKIFYIYPVSSTVNPRLNPQNNDVADIYNAQNMSKNFERNSNCPYLNFEALIEYNTAGNTSTNSSNVFLHYSYTSNLAKVFGKNFPNSYLQFQLGYALDVTKIFKSQTTANTGT